MSTPSRPGGIPLDWRVTAFAGRPLVLAALALVAVAVVPGPAPLIGAASALLLASLVLAEPRPTSLRVTVGASTTRCTAGDVVRFAVTWDADGQVHVTGQPHPDRFVEAAGRQPWRLPKGSPTSYDLRPTSWRVGSPGHLELRVASRLGGWAAVVRVALPELIVHPGTHHRPDVYAPPQLLSQLGAHVGRARGIGTEFAEIREYAAGDPLRDVNWRASARTGGLMVSQRYRDQAADVVILLDHLGLQDAYDRRLTDAAVTGAAAVARAYLGAGDRVGVILYQSPLRWVPPGQGQAQQMRLLDQLVVPPALNSYLDPEVTRIPAAALPSRAVVFCFSPLLDGRMLGAIGELTSRGHRLVIVDLAGIEPREWPAGLARETPQVWREHRLELRRRLSESGAMVVDDPGDVVVAVRLMARRGVA